MPTLYSASIDSMAVHFRIFPVNFKQQFTKNQQVLLTYSFQSLLPYYEVR